mmetsp:Transcript_15303/g.24901  ORF Transcript_15303/g.24901 Transcript_15303/m.24901 type:complete len:248 (-) Transcript_15303:1433-2176(-)
MSWSKVPCCTILPPSNTAIWLAARIVDSLWAIDITVLPSRIFSTASWTWYSLSASSAEVASSKRTIGGFLSIARAIATRCFCPPDNVIPRSPTGVAIPSGKFSIKSRAFATLAASFTWSLCASKLPYLILSSIVPEKRTGSCITTPMRDLNQCGSILVISIPSILTEPLIGSYSRIKRNPIVLFPLPLPPTRARLVPLSSLRFRPERIGGSGRRGYPKVTLLNSTSPSIGGVKSLPATLSASWLNPD